MALTIVNKKFHLNGTILNEGEAAEGLIMNSRMVQATIDFSAESEVSNWNADANTAAFINQLPNYKSYGLNGVTLSFQGGNFEAGWDESYDAGAWNSDGTLRPAHADRMEAVLDACIALGIIPIVGLTYFRQDQIMTNEAAVLNMVEEAKIFLAPWKDDIIVEVSNESTSSLFVHAILKENRVHEIIDDLVLDGYFASASWHGTFIPSVEQQGDGQIVLHHQNGLTNTQIETQIDDTETRFPDLPIVVNEDGLITTTPTQAVTRMNLNVGLGVSWGFHDPVDFQYWDGTNMTTMDWTIRTPLQTAVFDEFAILTGTGRTTLYATGDGTFSDVVNEADNTIDLFASVSDDPQDPDDDNWVKNAVAVS